MTEASFEKIRQTQRRIILALLRATGKPDLQTAIKTLRDGLKSGLLPPVEWIHKIAQLQVAQLQQPPTEPDTLPLDRFDEVLAAIDTPEKCEMFLSMFPEEHVPLLEAFQHDLLFKIIPGIKRGFESTAKAIPRPPSGGRKPVIPSEKKCQEIRAQIASLIAKDVSAGDAQKRIKAQTGLSIRTIQRITARKKDTLWDVEND